MANLVDAKGLRTCPDCDPAVTFLYLGRRGALGQFTHELMQAAARVPGHQFEVIVSSDSSMARELEESGLAHLTVPTFSRSRPLNLFADFNSARRLILGRLQDGRPKAVVVLMPHVWTPLLAPAIKRLGIKYVPIIHDARAHPGDKTAWVTRWLRRDAKHGDLVITLSRTVAESLAEARLAGQNRILPLFHPDLTFGSSQSPRAREPGAPLRLLFFGRVMAYRGLNNLIDAVTMLREDGVAIELGVAGSGELGDARERLEILGAEIINRWIDEAEVTAILDRYDAMACPHVEASQSGAAATAFGHCMPVVAMPIGGIAEQVVEGKTGVLASHVSTGAFADAIRRLASEPGLYEDLSRHLALTAQSRSMDTLLREMLRKILV